MRGIDYYQRHFIVIKYQILAPIRINKVLFEIDQTYLLTVFQRYSDSVSSWNKAGNYQGPILEETSVGLNHEEKKMFTDRLVSIIKHQFVIPQTKLLMEPPPRCVAAIAEPLR